MERTDKILTRSQATSSLMDTAAPGPLLSSLWGVGPVVASVDTVDLSPLIAVVDIGWVEAVRKK